MQNFKMEPGIQFRHLIKLILLGKPIGEIGKTFILFFSYWIWNKNIDVAFVIVDLLVSSLISISFALFIFRLCCEAHNMPHLLYFGVSCTFHQHDIPCRLLCCHLEFCLSGEHRLFLACLLSGIAFLSLFLTFLCVCLCTFCKKNEKSAFFIVVFIRGS